MSPRCCYKKFSALLKVSNNNNPRAVALEAICSVVLRKESLSNFKFSESLHDLSLAKSLTYSTIRFYHQLNDIVSSLLKSPIERKHLDIHCLILLGANQILYSNIPSHAAIFETVEVANILDKSWAKGLVNAILREIDRKQDTLLNNTHYSHPSWLVKKIKRYYPKNFEQIFSQNNIQAPMTIRVNPSYSLDSYKKSLELIGIDSVKLAVAPQSLVLKNAVDVFLLPKFNNGSCYVQDASAQLAAHIIEPKDNERILDACAAPGGKTIHLSELAPNSVITALDCNISRLEKLKENINRHKIKNVAVAIGNAQNQDWWNGEKFDKILIDAPCSATGIIRRHPDIKLLRKPKDINALIALQKEILGNLWTLLKPGGILVYSTCSILKSENEEQISSFFDSHKDATEEKIKLDWGIDACFGMQQLPTKHFDGFYYARIIKDII